MAWRPINAQNFYFIQCIALFGKDAREKGLGSRLIEIAFQDAIENNKSGLCAMSSKGPWIANKSLFEKNEFEVVNELDRFELLVKSIETKSIQPSFFNWIEEQKKYSGWNLIYSDQCPWHEKAIIELQKSAGEQNLKLEIIKLKSAHETQAAPSGFGTFSLIKDGKLLAYHYISKTRFENIIRNEH